MKRSGAIRNGNTHAYRYAVIIIECNYMSTVTSRPVVMMEKHLNNRVREERSGVRLKRRDSSENRSLNSNKRIVSSVSYIVNVFLTEYSWLRVKSLNISRNATDSILISFIKPTSNRWLPTVFARLMTPVNLCLLDQTAVASLGCRTSWLALAKVKR